MHTLPEPGTHPVSAILLPATRAEAAAAFIPWEARLATEPDVGNETPPAFMMILHAIVKAANKD